MVTVYHSHFGFPYESVRIVVILLVYFSIAVAILEKCATEKFQFIDLIKKHLPIILFFTFFCFFMNYLSITLVIRFYQEELVKFLYSKIQQQEIFERTLQNLEECIISTNAEKGIIFSNRQGMDLLTNLHLFQEN